jgi:hypothetical protein
MLGPCQRKSWDHILGTPHLQLVNEDGNRVELILFALTLHLV